jgi:hypothetical protein
MNVVYYCPLQTKCGFTLFLNLGSKYSSSRGLSHKLNTVRPKMQFSLCRNLMPCAEVVRIMSSGCGGRERGQSKCF